MRVFAAVCSLILLPAMAAGQQKSALASAQFLTGIWDSKQPNGLAEQTWTTPRAGAIVGMFRLIEGSSTRLLELLTITDKRPGLELRIQRFDPALGTVQGAPSVYRSTRADAGAMVFESERDNLRFFEMVHDPKRETLTITLRPRDARQKALVFRYKRRR